jgi:HEAT repeat protein
MPAVSHIGIIVAAAALTCASQLSPGQAPETPPKQSAPQPGAQPHPYHKDASLDTIGTWLQEEYARLAEADMLADLKSHPDRPAPQCLVINSIPRLDVMPEQEWIALAQRCKDEIRTRTGVERAQAIHFLLQVEQVSLGHPDFVAKLPTGFGAAIAGALASEDAEVRLAAAGLAGSLRHLGDDALLTAPGLLKALGDADAKLRSAASNALSELALGFEMPGYKVQPKGLGESGRAAVEVLLGAAQDNDRMVRIRVLSTVGDLGEAARGAVPRLAKLINAEDRVTRAGAFMALKKLGPIAADALPDLLAALRKGPDRDRVQAAHAIGAMGASAKDAVPALIEALDDPEPSVTWAAARALGDVGPDAAAALPRLEKAVETDPDAFSGFGRRAIDQITGR